MKEFNYKLTEYSILNKYTGDIVNKVSTDLGIYEWVKANLASGETLLEYREITGFANVPDSLYSYLMEVLPE